jgi:hypothetical protein
MDDCTTAVDSLHILHRSGWQASRVASLLAPPITPPQRLLEPIALKPFPRGLDDHESKSLIGRSRRFCLEHHLEFFFSTNFTWEVRHIALMFMS